LVLRCSIPIREQRIFVLTPPLQNSILQAQGRNATLASSVQAACDLKCIVIHAQNKVWPVPQHRLRMPIRLVNETGSVAEPFLDGAHVIVLVAKEANDFQRGFI
jgi:hypothetical protein